MEKFKVGMAILSLAIAMALWAYVSHNAGIRASLNSQYEVSK